MPSHPQWVPEAAKPTAELFVTVSDHIQVFPQPCVNLCKEQSVISTNPHSQPFEQCANAKESVVRASPVVVVVNVAVLASIVDASVRAVHQEFSSTIIADGGHGVPPKSGQAGRVNRDSTGLRQNTDRENIKYEERQILSNFERYRSDRAAARVMDGVSSTEGHITFPLARRGDTDAESRISNLRIPEMLE